MSSLSFKNFDGFHSKIINKNIVLKTKIKTKTWYCYILKLFSCILPQWALTLTLKNGEERYYWTHFIYGNTEAQRKWLAKTKTTKWKSQIQTFISEALSLSLPYYHFLVILTMYNKHHWALTISWLSVKCFTCVITFNPHNNPIQK